MSEFPHAAPPAIEGAADRVAAVRTEVARAFIGQPQALDQILIALLAGGHVLIEGVPGLGKTLLVRALAQALSLDFARVQFTPDLMPSDVSGHAVFDPGTQRFEIRRGPVFTHLLLADEINRAPPRTQSALLEAMAEHQVTLDGTTHRLEEPFFVIATQNPVDLSGTYPLPDSQLDRFLLRMALGYPEPKDERALLAGSDRRELIAQARPLLGVEQVLELRAAVAQVHASDALLDYVQALVNRSRRQPGVRVGLSPRAGLALLRGARAHALLLGRDHVIPEDVQALFAAVAAHRLVPDAEGASATDLAQAIAQAVAVD